MSPHTSVNELQWTRRSGGLRPLLRHLVPILALAASALQARPQALFYLTRDPAAVASFLAHADKIDVVVPAWYRVDAAGVLAGQPDPVVLETARAHHVPVMPTVVNPGFNQAMFHQLLASAPAHQAMIQNLLAECAKNGYSGMQFDFENILATDRDALSALVREAAASFHEQHVKLSIATVPNAPAPPGTGGFYKWIYSNWRAAYDLKALGEAVDLVCLMTYDQHTRYTPPGPVAGYQWTQANLEYALRFVPKEKLSLGVPTYGYLWFAGTPKNDQPNLQQSTVSGAEVAQLIAAYHPTVEWDAADRSAWFYFYRDATREWVFFTDRRTFQARWELVKAAGIQGFCSWVLGKEDPAIWDLLPSHP